MDEWKRISIERECERLVTAYCHLVDHGEAAKIADLFTEDGVWTSPEFTANNREEVRAAMTQRQENANRMSRHVCNNFQLDVIDDDHAEGVVYLTLYRNCIGDIGYKDKPRRIGIEKAAQRAQGNVQFGFQVLLIKEPNRVLFKAALSL